MNGDTGFAPDTQTQELLQQALRAQQKNELERAEKLFTTLLKRAPHMSAGLHYFGLLQHQRNRHEQARELLLAAERLAPQQPDFLFNHAHVLWEQARPADAVARLERLLALRPDSASAIRELTLALTALGKGTKACTNLADWLTHHPHEYPLWLMLGDLRLQAGEPELAVQAWDIARKASGELGGAALQRIGNRQLQVANVNAAGASFRAAIACHAGSANAHCGLAATAGQRGDFVTQRDAANAALKIDPLCYTAWYQLTLSPDENPEALASKMRKAVAHAAEDPQAWLLYMALGRVLEELNQYDDAFGAFTEANHRRRKATGENYAREILHFKHACKYLNAEFVQRRPSRSTLTYRRPLFIIGMPRSGTTLVEAILGTHPKIAAGGEMQFLYTWLRKNVRTPFNGIFPKWLAQANDRLLDRLAHEWQHALDKACGGHDRISDKYPENFLLLGLIAIVFPHASIVHVHRDPRDTCVSCFTTALTGRGVSAAATLAEIGNYYREYEMLMDHWRQVLGPERIIEVEYEHLIHAPEPTVRKLLADVGLEWNPQCLDFHKSRRPVATASLYQIRQPIYDSSIGRWRRFESHLAPLFDSLSGILPDK
jgi:tetratricopeptide (TPR) repeat protein